MRRRMASGAVAGAVALACAAGVRGQAPDVIVGDLYDLDYYGSANGVHAFAVGTISCNIGTTGLKWIRNTNEHPVICQNMYRFKDGRFEQIGLSWLKHGFTALTGNVCSTCPPGSAGGAVLSPGCSDPYSASLNGGQTSAGPRWQVNAASGYFVYPPANPAWNGITARRLQVKDEDINPALNAGATYFVEGQYITRDDALAGNGWNNASYRKITIQYGGPGSVTPSLAGTTQRTKPAIYAWQEMDPSVQVATVTVPSDGVYIDSAATPPAVREAPGTMHVAVKVTDNGDGTWTYDYAVQNVTSDRSAGGLRLELPAGVVAEDFEFKGCAYHSGDGLPTNLTQPNTTARNYSDEAWTVSVDGSTLRWATEAYEVNPNANAVRWGTLYNFRFRANAQPGMGTGTIELFKPADPNASASPSEVTFNLPAPSVFVPRNIRVRVDAAALPELAPPNQPLMVMAEIQPGDEDVEPGSARLHYSRADGSGAEPFTPVSMTLVSGTTYSAVIPAAGCGTVISFYVEAMGVSSGRVTWPPLGADAPHTLPVGVVTEAATTDFEGGEAGWTRDPADTATAAGRWVWGDPVGTSYNPGTGPVAIQPGDDHTPGAGVNCWFTGQGSGGSPASAADVDGGRTTLLSPVVDLSEALTARVRYWRWYFGGTASGRNDPFVSQISNDGGQTWTDVEVVPATAGTGGWVLVDVPVTIPLTSQMQVRFIAQDLPPDDVVEAAVDDFGFVTTGCDDTCRADWNGDGQVSLQDWLGFLVGYFAQEGDYNRDGVTSVQDVYDFLVGYFGGC